MAPTGSGCSWVSGNKTFRTAVERATRKPVLTSKFQHLKIETDWGFYTILKFEGKPLKLPVPKE